MWKWLLGSSRRAEEEEGEGSCCISYCKGGVVFVNKVDLCYPQTAKGGGKSTIFRAAETGDRKNLVFVISRYSYRDIG